MDNVNGSMNIILLLYYAVRMVEKADFESVSVGDILAWNYVQHEVVAKNETTMTLESVSDRDITVLDKQTTNDFAFTGTIQFEIVE